MRRAFGFCVSLLAHSLFLRRLVWLEITNIRVMSGLSVLHQFFFGIVKSTALITFERIRY
jgi:hypothetical protein